MAKEGSASWFHKKIVDPLLQILRRGAEPKQLAFSAAFGTTLGVFPIYGVTVFLCGMGIALLRSRCHAPTVMLANLIATPIELSLVVPFLRFGETLCGGPQFPLTSDALKKVLTGQASREVLLSIAHALLGWLVAAPFILATLYVILLPCFKLLVHKFSPAPLSPEKQLNSPSDVRLKGGFLRSVHSLDEKRISRRMGKRVQEQNEEKSTLGEIAPQELARAENCA